MKLSSTIKFSPVNIEERRGLDFKAGDTVRVWQKVKEGDKTRLQAFEGLVIAKKHGREPGATLTVRKISGGIGVERIFPLYAPSIEKIELVKKGKARRAKLYYLRERAAKAVRKKIKQEQVGEKDKADKTDKTEKAAESTEKQDGEENKKE